MTPSRKSSGSRRRCGGPGDAAPRGLWSVRPRPQRDELLSSWLLRIARAQGQKLQSFCATVWGRERQIWNRDIDRLADDAFLAPLAEGTGVGLERARQTTLSDLAGVVFERVNPGGNTPLILPLGIYHRLRSRHGTQFCPECLAADPAPYFRRRWRLAAWVVCPVHRRLLHDRCPRCGSPVNFHRGEMGDRRRTGSRSPVFCSTCRCDYRAARVADLPEEVLHGLIEWQRRFDGGLDEGMLRLNRRVWLHPLAFFQGLRLILSVVCRCNSTHDLRWFLAERGPFPDRLPFLRGRGEFERMDVTERARALCWAEMLLEDWPSRFINWCLGTGTLSSAFTKDRLPLPFWLGSVVSEHLYVVHSVRPPFGRSGKSFLDAGLKGMRRRRRRRAKRATLLGSGGTRARGASARLLDHRAPAGEVP